MISIFNKIWQRYTEYVCYEWWMLKKRRGYYRHPRTHQERKRWFRDEEDEIKLRKRRGPRYLNPWNCDLENPPSCMTMKSWKKLSKKRKQWMD